MKLALITTVSIVVLLAVDWFAIGVGPLPQIAISRCDKHERISSGGIPSGFTGFTAGGTPDRSASRKDCQEAWRDGRLSIRGSIG